MAPGMLDFAVNVRGTTPEWLREKLRARVDDLSTYPSPDDEDAAVGAIAAAHGRDDAEIAVLSGAAEGFALAAGLRPRHAVVIAPSFTEPERVLRAAGVPVTRVVLPPPWRVTDAVVPDDADLVVVGNPTNPTSVLHPAGALLALCRPGRVVLVDEAFADVTLAEVGGDLVDEPQSVAGRRLPGLVVLRSVTKTFAVPGLRAGYLVGDADVVARMVVARPHWPVGTLQLAAVTAALGPIGRDHARAQARQVRAERDTMCRMLVDAGVTVCGDPQASFVLVHDADALARRGRLADAGVAVRRCDTFPGLGADHLRLAVRGRDDVATLLRAWSAS
ncbi:Rv2231c family pyridoxal phosphate-dependent protein CobC [Williamsia serinedens]|uniref:Rv2231c family pyridoxal phosphate-dependent protein CobC n=1 Tax=Williamsia serinedens TaxID=391736 RepID=UPI0020A3DC92